MKLKWKRILTAVLATSMVAACLTGCSNNADGTEDGKLVMGLDTAFPPMGFLEEGTNNIVGFDVDLAREVAKRLDLELVTQPIDWNTKELELSSGGIDVIWNGLTRNEKREAEMLLSDTYLKNEQVIVVPADSEIAAKADLEGKVLGLQTGSSAQDALNADEIKDKLSEVVEYADNVSALTDLKAGRLDAVLVDMVVADYYIKLEPDNFKKLDESLAKEDYVIAFKKGNTKLRDRVQQALDEMIEDGTAAKISEEWFGKDILVK